LKKRPCASRSVAVACGSLLLASCGGGGSPGAPAAPSNPYQIVISTSGAMTPSQISIPAGSRVLFVNNHSRAHQIASDPHPDHTDCPEINQVGLLNPGQSRETGNLVTVRTCGVHDHDDPFNTALHARIIIQ
jgi:plastocyanin